MISIDWSAFSMAESIEIDIVTKDGEVFNFKSSILNLKSFAILVKEKEYRKGIWDVDDNEDRNKGYK